jgi:hypothetical protein
MSENIPEMVDMKVTRELRDKLKLLGRKGETYDAVIRRLIDEAKYE